MNGLLAGVLIGLALLLALGAGVYAGRDRLPGRLHLQGLFVLQALLLVQAVVVVVQLGDWDGSVAEMLGYLVVSALLVPGGMVLAVEERTRWGTLVLAAACLTVAVVVVRLLAVWESGV